MKKTTKAMKIGVLLSIIAVITIIVYSTTRGFASGTAFSYNVGTTFVVDGYQFKIVDKASRYAVATSRLISADWGKATLFAESIGEKYSYIRKSGLPGYADYNDATFRSNVGADGTWEWTSTPYRDDTSGYFWVGSSAGVAGFYNYSLHGAASTSYGVRPALYLKSGLYITGTNGTLYEPLPGTFGDLTIQ